LDPQIFRKFSSSVFLTENRFLRVFLYAEAV